jgi:CRP-like cAMP-binding protein
MASKTELKALKMLRSVALTRDMELEHLHKLASLATEVEFLESEIIYCRGDMGKAVYLIEEGQVVIETDIPGQGPVTLNILGPGQFFGWSSLFPPERKMASTRALVPTRAIAINARQLRAAWQMDHYLEYAIVRRAGRDMVNRIKATRQQLVDMLVLPMTNN